MEQQELIMARAAVWVSSRCPGSIKPASQPWRRSLVEQRSPRQQVYKKNALVAKSLRNIAEMGT
jgi:hypothetical protein